MNLYQTKWFVTPKRRLHGCPPFTTRYLYFKHHWSAYSEVRTELSALSKKHKSFLLLKNAVSLFASSRVLKLDIWPIWKYLQQGWVLHKFCHIHFWSFYKLETLLTSIVEWIRNKFYIWNGSCLHQADPGIKPSQNSPCYHFFPWWQIPFPNCSGIPFLTQHSTESGNLFPCFVFQLFFFFKFLLNCIKIMALHVSIGPYALMPSDLDKTWFHLKWQNRTEQK